MKLGRKAATQTLSEDKGACPSVWVWHLFFSRTPLKSAGLPVLGVIPAIKLDHR